MNPIKQSIGIFWLCHYIAFSTLKCVLQWTLFTSCEYGGQYSTPIVHVRQDDPSFVVVKTTL